MSDQAPALHASVPPPTDSDYDSILAAVMETARGRWFLHEYARRNRSADTGALLAAIGRIEALLEARDIDAPDQAEQATPLDVPAQQLAATQAAMAATLDSLIECGAPSFLCDDLARHLKTLRALGTPGQQAALDRTQATPAQSVEVEMEVLEVQTETADMAAATVRTELPAVTIEPMADAAPLPPPSPAPETIDAFADIRALSASEKIALFS